MREKSTILVLTFFFFFFLKISRPVFSRIYHHETLPVARDVCVCVHLMTGKKKILFLYR